MPRKCYLTIHTFQLINLRCPPTKLRISAGLSASFTDVITAVITKLKAISNIEAK